MKNIGLILIDIAGIIIAFLGMLLDSRIWIIIPCLAMMTWFIVDLFSHLYSKDGSTKTHT